MNGVCASSGHDTRVDVNATAHVATAITYARTSAVVIVRILRPAWETPVQPLMSFSVLISLVKGGVF